MNDMTIKETLQKLPESARAKLMYCFEHKLTGYVCLPNKQFIGVHTSTLGYLQPTQFAGDWTMGINIGPVDEVVEI